MPRSITRSLAKNNPELQADIEYFNKLGPGPAYKRRSSQTDPAYTRLELPELQRFQPRTADREQPGTAENSREQPDLPDYTSDGSDDDLELPEASDVTADQPDVTAESSDVTHVTHVTDVFHCSNMV